MYRLLLTTFVAIALIGTGVGFLHFTGKKNRFANKTDSTTALTSTSTQILLGAKNRDTNKPDSTPSGEKTPTPTTTSVGWQSKKPIDEQVFDGVVALYKKTLESTSAVSVKSWAVVDSAPTSRLKGRCVKLLVEFTKDADLDWDRRLYGINGGGLGTPTHVEFYFFDHENVRLGTRTLHFRMHEDFGFGAFIDGDVTRKKGEAFRIFVKVDHLLDDQRFLRNTRRLEVHFRKPTKLKTTR